MPVIDVSTSEFAEKVLLRSGEVPVVVDFWAAWCGPCRVLGPILERTAAEAQGEWELVKVDVDQNQQLAAEFGVQGIPAVIGFRDGRPAARFTGALPEAQVRQWLRELVPSRADRLAAGAVTALEAGDVAGAESGFREALFADPAHLEAGAGLARLLLDRGEPEEAGAILSALPDTETVRGLTARARLMGSGLDVDLLREKVDQDPENWQAHLDLGRALAAEGSYAEAFDHLQQVVEADPQLTDQARTTMVDLFSLVDDPALISDYRRRLANALF